MDVCEVPGIRTFILVNAMYQSTGNIYLCGLINILLVPYSIVHDFQS